MERKKPTYLIYILILSVFHIVGVFGLCTPSLEPLFRSLTPFQLMFTTVLVLLNFPKWSAKSVMAIVLVFSGGYILEVIGVKTQLIFGDYSYGPTLGPKLFEVPLIIGLNWLILVYGSLLLARRLISFPIAYLILASILMVGLDFLIEPIAIRLDFWTWAEGEVPLQNYLGWLGGSLLFLFCFDKILPGNAKYNPVAEAAFLIQWVFFTLLLLLM